MSIALLYFRNVDTRACFRCCLNEKDTKSGRGGGRGGSGTDGGGLHVGVLYEWGWMRCLIYLKIIDVVLGCWMFFSLWWSMTLKNVSITSGGTFLFMILFISMMVCY